MNSFKALHRQLFGPTIDEMNAEIDAITQYEQWGQKACAHANWEAEQRCRLWRARCWLWRTCDVTKVH